MTKKPVSVWDKSIKVEENGYYWKDHPIINKREYVNTGKPTAVELFSGCGGTSKGFEMAGFDILLGADIHQPSIDTFFKNHKNASTILGDLKTISTSQFLNALPKAHINVAIAGVPCQGFSLNNRKRHEDDERNYLFKEYMRFVRVLQPDVVVLENVSGLKSTANGDFVKAITLEIKKSGYPFVSAKLLNAADYGVPQNRFRLIFVGTKEKEFIFPKETHGPKTSLPYLTVKDAIYDLPHIKAGEISDRYSSKPISSYQKLMRKNTGEILFNHEAPNHPDETINKIRSTKQGHPMYPKFKQRIRLSWDMPSPTQVSGGIRPQFQFGHPEIARGLTIRERCRIQSFPDDFIIEGGLVQGRVQTGNAVPPLLAKAIAGQILKLL